MFSEQTSVIESESNQQNKNNDFDDEQKNKKIIIFVVIGIVLVGLIISGFFVFKNITEKQQAAKVAQDIKKITDAQLASSSSSTKPLSTTSILPINLNTATTSASSSFSEIAVEYLSFADFYTAPNKIIDTKFTDYELPLNIKIDISNYYNLSRKLNLDPGLESLSNDGFAIIDNPWLKEAPDFYSIYSNLEKKQIPILITSDFVLYYYQTILKQVFKDIEENIFYNNLWSINKDLYNSAKNRYEARLASIGDINDSILEGERLEAAFFAVSLELLKPSLEQTTPKDAPLNTNKFSASDSNHYYFVTPPYLKDDVARELKLIREAREKVKSPIMLYVRDYKEFYIPNEYRSNARLNNFFLTKKWLNSVFPLNYRDKNCPSCLLDKEDWRLAIIAASFISVDFSDLPDLKNKWARIYKVMSFFDPLRADLNYVYYRDTLKSIFGESYNIEVLFDDKNPEAKNNLTKFQVKLNTLEFSPFLGGIDKNDVNVNYRRGFKMLSENYSPNDYIFNRLSYPQAGTYIGTTTQLGNISACEIKNVNVRCNGVALDVINLIKPITSHNYFEENSNYTDYGKEYAGLNLKVKKDLNWQNANYWSTLSAINSYLNTPKDNLPLFTKSLAWYNQNLSTATGAWVDMQIAGDKFKINEAIKSQSLGNFDKYRDNSYIEPNLNLINELIANTEMIQKMLAALQVDREVISVKSSLNSLSAGLISLQNLVIKELSNEAFSPQDNENISNFTKQLSVEGLPASQKQLSIKFPNTKKSLKEDLSRLKLMVLVHQEGEEKVFSVGPVWSVLESH